MKQSLFLNYVLRFFPILQTLITKINGKRNSALTYYHKDPSILHKEYAPDNKFEVTSVNTTYVAADYVSFDSSLPIKSRDTIAGANGKLPKIGMAKKLKESDINAINLMQLQGGNTAEISRRLVQDVVACSVGLDERNEYAFLFALSNGYVAIKDDESENLMRLNFGYLDENTFGVETAGKLTISDFDAPKAKAENDGNSIVKAWIAKSTYDALRKTDEAKVLCANYSNSVFTDVKNLPVPSRTVFNEAFEDEYGFGFEVVDRTVTFESNGTRKSIKPFNANRVILCCANMVGAFVYGRLAEQTNPVADVQYQTIESYKLIAKYSETNPLREATTGQAMCAPIIEDADLKYIIDLETTLDKTEDSEGDGKISVWGNKYPKVGFVAALNDFAPCASNATDKDVLNVVGSLSKKAMNDLKTAVESIKEA